MNASALPSVIPFVTSFWLPLNMNSNSICIDGDIVATRMLQSTEFRLLCEFFVATLFFMARAKKKEDEAKTDTLRIRLTETERDTINRAAAAKTLETSTWARMELMALAKRILARQD
jgi:hypothetical protein